MPQSVDRSQYDPACQCRACQRIRDLDNAARVANGETAPDNQPSRDFWAAWDDHDYDNPGEDRTGVTYNGQRVETTAPVSAAQQERERQRQQQIREAEEANRRRREQRNVVLETIEAPEACQFCGNQSEPYAVEGRIACESCYNNECQRLYHCAGCSNRLDANANFLFQNRRYCNRCIRTRQDHCHSCGSIAERGTMSRDSRQRAVCRDCYRPEWKPSEWTVERNTYALIAKGFTYGIELETSVSENYADLEGRTAWGCVPEASTSGREFVSPVMSGDAGLAELNDFITRWGRNWQVDAYCGTHIHIGLGQFNMEQKRRIAYGYYCMWNFIADLIGPARAQNSMCGRPQWTLGDLMGAGDIEDFAEARDRFEFVNWRSLLKYGTIEIRCLKGTLDPELIGAWLRWHCKFIKKCAGFSYKALQRNMVDPMAFGTNLDPELVNILRRRMGVDRNEQPARTARGAGRLRSTFDMLSSNSGRGR